MKTIKDIIEGIWGKPAPIDWNTNPDYKISISDAIIVAEMYANQYEGITEEHCSCCHHELNCDCIKFRKGICRNCDKPISL